MFILGFQMMNLLLGVVARPESATELCLGPGRCRTGKGGIEKSSSSFQVKSSFFYNLLITIYYLVANESTLNWLKPIHFVSSVCSIFILKNQNGSFSPNLSKLTSAVILWKQNPCAELFTQWMDFSTVAFRIKFSLMLDSNPWPIYLPLERVGYPY